MLEVRSHPFSPIFNADSKILILGTIPSTQSLASGFYYGHPSNRFWKIISRITKSPKIPQAIEEKKTLLLQHKIALFDVIQECQIEGSSDKSIQCMKATDISSILEQADIRQIYTNGRKAYELSQKYYPNSIAASIIYLPSTSAANAQYNEDQLFNIWCQICQYLR